MRCAALVLVAAVLLAACASNDGPCTMQPGSYQLIGSTGLCNAVFPGLHSDGTIARLATDLCGSGCVPPAGCAITWSEAYGTTGHVFLSCTLMVDGDHGSGSCTGSYTDMGGTQSSCNGPLTLTRTGP